MMMSRLPDVPIASYAAARHVYQFGAVEGLIAESIEFDDASGAQLVISHTFTRATDERETVQALFHCARGDDAQLVLSDELDAVYSVTYFYDHFVAWCDWRARRLQVDTVIEPVRRRISQDADSLVYQTARGDWLQIDTLFDPRAPVDQMNVWSACASDYEATPWRWPRASYNESVADVVNLFGVVVDMFCTPRRNERF